MNATTPASEAEGQRPKLENRIDAAMNLLRSLAGDKPGVDAALNELSACITALDIQGRVEVELLKLALLAPVPAPLPKPAAAPVLQPSDDL